MESKCCEGGGKKRKYNGMVRCKYGKHMESNFKINGREQEVKKKGDSVKEAKKEEGGKVVRKVEEGLGGKEAILSGCTDPWIGQWCTTS